VDFAFWDGKRITAVEVDDSSQIGNSHDVTKDRMLSDRMLNRAGVDVLHILSIELEEFGVDAIDRLLPASIRSFWDGEPERRAMNPMMPF